ncbi:RNA polymerase sigma factor (sigma-70 family) [Psychromicrobium silvestre]|uniref:RNA polymerase sigma factor (Sigma-70 family) n=1 Tax=Psychromicrobium silvestre TaxID=1645614 RepID=A0A7Y9LVF0_9MICC|nr:RNA polymerase sigma factor [Psychromicrobium silvestre]NYE96339.1 RNA polymerase sigma factor (sigma-70 family) [Psychromicrobium silvestre]
MVAKQPFEQVVQLHGATVLRVCRAVLGVEEAEDAWSETFLSALKAYPELAAEANIEAWLVTIAHRKALDLVRSRGRRAITVSALPERVSTLGLPGEGEPELLAAVAALPAKQRQAVAYHFLAGLPYQGVSSILGGTPEAARRAASDGIKSLRAAIDVKGESR